MLTSPTDVGVVTNDSLSAWSAVAQQAAQPIDARFTRTRAARPRLNLRNVAGVSKPAKPSSRRNGNGDVPAAVRSDLASSRKPVTACQTASRERNGVGVAGSGGISTGAPSVSRVTMIRYSESARIVFAKPFTADFCGAVRAVLASANATRFTALR